MSQVPIRRLTNDDVRTIFDCVYNDKVPSDKRLMFKIIVVGSDGMKLSPPSYEFDDGLYILLKPLKKAKGERIVRYQSNPQDDPRIPSNLKSMVFTEEKEPTCPWSLSGPQFPVPTAIQQRYCYPKGDPSYSTMKGGALWTAYDQYGREDLEFRLLHVYYSAKRAGKTGHSLSTVNNPAKRARLSKPRRPSAPPQRPSTPPSSIIGSFSSDSLDSPLSLNLPSSPIDPSIFSLANIFPKACSDDKDVGNSDEKIITPDRSVFDVSSPVVQSDFSRRHDVYHQGYNSSMYSYPYDRNRTPPFPSTHPYGQYYRPYSYWPSHSGTGNRSSQDIYRRYSDPRPSQQYPTQEERRNVPKVRMYSLI